MKLPPTTTTSRVVANMILAPEHRPVGDDKKVPHLCYGDTNSNHCVKKAPKELLRFVIGSNVPGELPNNLDRLTNHVFLIRLDKDDTVVGLDIIPARSYRGGVTVASQVGVTNLQITWETDDKMVRRVTARPKGATSAIMVKVMDALTALAKEKKDIPARKKLGDLGTIVSFDGEVMEIRLNTVAAVQPVNQDPYGFDSKD